MKGAMRSSSRSKGGSSGLIIGVVVAVLVVGGAAAYWFFLRSTPEKTIHEYVAASKAGNETAAKALLTSDTVKAMDDFQKSLSSLSPMVASMAGTTKMATSLIVHPGLEADVEVGKAQVQGDTATVPVKLKIKQIAGKAVPATSRLANLPARPITLKREGGKWKIDMSKELALQKQMATALLGGKGSQGLQQMAKQMAARMKSSAGAGKGGQGQAPRFGGLAPSASPAGGDTAKLIADGMAEKKAGHLDAAAAKLKQACQADPKSCDAHWGLAWVLVSQGNKAEAKAEFQKVIALNADPKKTSGARDALARMK